MLVEIVDEAEEDEEEEEEDDDDEEDVERLLFIGSILLRILLSVLFAEFVVMLVDS